MNTNVFTALITTPPTMNGDVCTFQAKIEPIKEGDEPAIVQVKAWGNTAKTAMKWSETEPRACMIGQLRTPKGSPVELHLSAIHPVTDGTNAVALVGRAGRDPEVRYFEKGTMVANFRLAVKGRGKDEPDWFNMEIWGKQAQVAADYVKKGSLIGVSGQLKFDSWTDKTTGEIRTKPVIRVDRLDLLGGRQESGESAPAAQKPWAGSPPAATGWGSGDGAL